jgi:hypothetical protein
MRKIQKSIRLKPEGRKVLKREVVRLTLNPVVVSLSERVVNWTGSVSDRRLHPSDLVVRAQERFPELPLSWAVEGYIVLLLLKEPQQLEALSVEPFDELPASVKRFASLSLLEKTEALERWKRTLQNLRRAV